ncbi:MAG TPA: peptidase M48 [Flavobacteriales bacterium]|jgi:predicted Zn-dependent protease|nr:M48 family metallopeptidase [Salibacteraceae bacterium]HAW18580.1 peptidase M48 [Flavobacteriales bacterium]
MKYAIRLTLLLFLVSCAKVPITGRRQLNMLPESQLMSMSLTEYKSFLSANETVSATDQAALVKSVGTKISTAVESYLKKHGQSKRVKDFNWEFNLVKDETVNAWCMPGGKVVFYTGILPITKDEAGLAVVMGHEIAHAIARHGNERMSQGLALQGGGMAIGVALSNQPELTQNLFSQAYGLSSQLGMLKYSRMHESEADKMGLVFMAMAGYDPREAPEFWKRMAAIGGQKPPEFLSTHPHDDTRIKDLNDYMDEALKHYKK